MENIWFISDTHFNHERIIKHCNRPFNNVNEMNEKLIYNWNTCVNKNDRVYIIGDFAFSEHESFFHRLKGKKHLIVGNHDRMSAKILNMFESVSEIKEIEIEKRTFILCHFPLRTLDKSMHGSVSLFGHVHGRINTNNLSFDIGVDTHNFMPYSYGEIIEMVRKREELMKKEHRIIVSENKGKQILQYFQDDVQYYQFIINKFKGIKK